MELHWSPTGFDGRCWVTRKVSWQPQLHMDCSLAEPSPFQTEVSNIKSKENKIKKSVALATATTATAVSPGVHWKWASSAVFPPQCQITFIISNYGQSGPVVQWFCANRGYLWLNKQKSHSFSLSSGQTLWNCSIKAVPHSVLCYCTEYRRGRVLLESK